MWTFYNPSILYKPIRQTNANNANLYETQWTNNRHEQRHGHNENYLSEEQQLEPSTPFKSLETMKTIQF